MTSESAEVEWVEWLSKWDRLLADAEEARKEARAKGGNKKVNTKAMIQKQCHIEDVARFEVGFGFGNAVLLANLPDVKTWYA
jgi:hypothetical protein